MQYYAIFGSFAFLCVFSSFLEMVTLHFQDVLCSFAPLIVLVLKKMNSELIIDINSHTLMSYA